MKKGTVKMFNSAKGFGFITPEDGGKEIFYHFSKILSSEKSLEAGQIVEFEIGEGKKGTEAYNIRVVG
ncbi:MAG: cold-shock protein [Chryseobacterium sp.]|uniref:cold-shock protein n=1 Tax=Chryseobacterium sp. TaxID=1871047 RepID=UPI0025BAA457|nr:cold-shock protein [Chryseobacterium sp.]MCJ7935542.1 cold-shock protein [Chryseobacterium sp.]